MENKEKEIIEKLEELKNLLEDEDSNMDYIRQKAAVNLAVLTSILNDLKEGKHIVEALSEVLRSYDDALAKCLEAGAKADAEFMYDFTTHYLNSILSLAGNLCLVKDFLKDSEHLAFIKSKVRECLIYIDRL